MWRTPIRITVASVAATAAMLTRRDPDSIFWKSLGDLTLQNLDAEQAHVLHKCFIAAGSYDLFPRLTSAQDLLARSQALKVHLWGLQFDNPIGVAAGLDKHAEAMNSLLSLGFSFVEVGSITPKPQPGNEQPRVFRLVPDRAVINRYGFNSEGLAVAKERLKAFRTLRRDPESAPWWRKILTTLDLIPEIRRTGIVGVNVGCNKENAVDPRNDYAEGIKQLGPEADYLVVNISSPNTPGLRAMQKKEKLESLIKSAMDARAEMLQTNKVDRFVPLLVKIAPDLSAEEMADIADIALRLKIDGLVVSNTTISRPLGLQSDPALVKETGGLSGAPLKSLAQKTLSEMYRLTKGQIPLIGVGGISNAKDAYDRIKAGASLVQLYTGITYEGIGVATKMHTELVELMKQDGLTKISQATGFDHRRRDGAAKAVAANAK